MDRKLLGGTSLLVLSLSLNLLALHEIGQLRDRIPDDAHSTPVDVEQELLSLMVGQAEMKDVLEGMRSELELTAGKADEASDRVDDVEFELASARDEARGARERADDVAHALCSASNYSTCP